MKSLDPVGGSRRAPIDNPPPDDPPIKSPERRPPPIEEPPQGDEGHQDTPIGDPPRSNRLDIGGRITLRRESENMAAVPRIVKNTHSGGCEKKNKRYRRGRGRFASC